MIDDLLERMRKFDKRAISRLISMIESNHDESDSILHKISDKSWDAYRIGITGPPGAGKSTITNQLTKLIRNEHKRVAVIAVDPTSPFSGGALLGDRIRMNDIGMDDGVFIRSMATRGSLGGLSQKASDTAELLSSAGYDYVILETVGVGQSELDIANSADTTMVVLVPESGDSIQTMKAGLMEIADFFVINKNDRPAAGQLESALNVMLSMNEYEENRWRPNIVRSIATENKGIEEIFEQILIHRNFLESKNLLIEKRKKQALLRVRNIVNNQLLNTLWNDNTLRMLEENIQNVILGKISSYELARKIFNELPR